MNNIKTYEVSQWDIEHLKAEIQRLETTLEGIKLWIKIVTQMEHKE